MKRKVTGEQVADAIKLGGYPVGKGHFFYSHSDDPEDKIVTDEHLYAHGVGKIHQACALGIGALNLGVSAFDLSKSLGESDLALLDTIFKANDKDGKTVEQISRMVRRGLKGKEFEVDTFNYEMVFNNYHGVKI